MDVLGCVVLAWMMRDDDEEEDGEWAMGLG